MVDGIKKKSKVINKIFMALAILLIVVVVSLGFLWNRYLNKNSLLKKFETTEEQEVYLLGTFHKSHFNKWADYSMEDILSVAQNIQPDAVFIEAREQSFEDYGVIDGPVDMAVVYSYCIDNNIPVNFIDWWVVDNNFQSNTTNDKRDDMIFSNIDNKLKSIAGNKKILVVCGSGHLYEQTERFWDHGFKEQKIDNKSAYFDSQDTEFKYPDNIENVWEQRSYFYAYTYPEVIRQDTTLDDEIKNEFTEGDHDAFYNQQLQFNELFWEDRLYQ